MALRASPGDPVVDRYGEVRICIDCGFIPGQALLDGRSIIKAWDEYGSSITPAEFLVRCRRVLRERAKEYPGSRLAERFRRSRALARESAVRWRSLSLGILRRLGSRFARSRARRGSAARRARRRLAALARDGDGDPPGPASATDAVAVPVALPLKGDVLGLRRGLHEDVRRREQQAERARRESTHAQAPAPAGVRHDVSRRNQDASHRGAQSGAPGEWQKPEAREQCARVSREDAPVRARGRAHRLRAADQAPQARAAEVRLSHVRGVRKTPRRRERRSGTARARARWGPTRDCVRAR